MSTAQISMASTALRQSVASRLREFMPRSSVLTEEEDLPPYECDGLSAYRKLPWIVALPETVEQARHVLKLCAEHNIPVVARGAGTGLSGGALPHEGGVLLSVSNFHRSLGGA